MKTLRRKVEDSGSFSRGSAGFSVTEMLIVLGVMSIVAGVMGIQLKQLDDPLQDGSAQVLSLVKKARAKAISTTSGYVVSATGLNQLQASVGNNCDDPSPVNDKGMQLTLPTGVSMTDTTWELCFNARGIATANQSIELYYDGRLKQIEVFLGGAARIIQ